MNEAKQTSNKKCSMATRVALKVKTIWVSTGQVYLLAKPAQLYSYSDKVAMKFDTTWKTDDTFTKNIAS